jgi:hypothetical protein
MNMVKALPALVIEESEVRRFAAALEEVISRAEHATPTMMRLGWRIARHRLSRRHPSNGASRREGAFTTSTRALPASTNGRDGMDRDGASSAR